MKKVECCGNSFETSRVPLVGLLTASVPLIVLSGMISVLLWPLALLWRPLGRARRYSNVLLSANLKLVSRASILPELRCSVSARLLRRAPVLSGLVYDHYNLILLLLVWIVGWVGVRSIA